ncbi:MAG: DUF488 domain-containing protein [Thermoanaerobaculia bacterium]
MTLRVVQLGSPRHESEGLRIGTVRRPPRGVPKERHAKDDWYDVWLPELAPSAELVKDAQRAESAEDWRAFARKYRKEMADPAKARLIELLAALSKRTNLSAGCYCDDETKCHRSVLRELLAERGAQLLP